MIEAKNPQYTEEGLIDCEINHEEYGWIPFTVHEKDPEEFGRELYAQLMEDPSQIKPYVKPADKTGTEALTALRQDRDLLLEDYIDPAVSNPLRWQSMSESDKTAIQNYRQALLDLPANSPNAALTFKQGTWYLINVTWPVPPSILNIPDDVFGDSDGS